MRNIAKLPAGVSVSIFVLSIIGCIVMPARFNPRENYKFEVIEIVDKDLRQDHLQQPQGVVATSQGMIFVADTDNKRVLLLDNRGKIVASYNRGTFLDQANRAASPQTIEFVAPDGICSDRNGGAYVADVGTIHHIQHNGQVETLKLGPRTSNKTDDKSNVYQPVSVEHGKRGEIYFVDFVTRKVFLLSADGAVKKFAGGGAEPVAVGKNSRTVNLDAVFSIAMNASGELAIHVENDQIFFVDESAKILRIIDAKKIVDPAGNKDLQPVVYCISFSPKGELFILDVAGFRVFRLDAAFKVVEVIYLPTKGFYPPKETQVDNPVFAAPNAISVEASGSVLILDYWTSAITRVYLKK